MLELHYYPDLDMWKQVALALHSAAFESEQITSSLSLQAKAISGLTEHLMRHDAKECGTALLALDWMAPVSILTAAMKKFSVQQVQSVEA